MPNVPIYTKPGGTEMVIDTGATLTVNGTLSGGGTITVPDGSVTTAKLANTAVTKAKSLMFVSAELTGTGSAQNVAHGLGVVPAAVLVVPTDTSPATVGQYTAVEGSHTSTNVIVTVTTGKKFKVWAMG